MSALSITPLTPTVGAEIAGVDLTRRLGHDEVDAIEEALLAHGVVFFRGQLLAPDQLLAFARQIGPVSAPPFGVRYQGDPELTVLDRAAATGTYGDEWHSDDTFLSEPPMGSILQAVELPTYGGDTCFANMHAAYDALSEPMKRSLDGLEAVHDAARALAQAPSVERGRLCSTSCHEVSAHDPSRRAHAPDHGPQGAVRERLRRRPAWSGCPRARTSCSCASSSTTCATRCSSAGFAGSSARSRTGTTGRCMATRCPTTRSGA